MSCIKKILFPAALESIFGAAFLRHHGSERLQKAFFAFEEGFELAASPVPHFLQPSFCKGRQALLEAFRWVVSPLPPPAALSPLPQHPTFASSSCRLARLFRMRSPLPFPFL